MQTKPIIRYPWRLRQPAAALVMASLLGFSSLGHAGLFADDQARTQLNSVAQDSANMKAQMQAQNSELQRQLDSLQKELDQLRRQEGAAHSNLTTVERRQRDIYIDLNNRLKVVEKAASAPAPMAHAAPATEMTAPLASEEPAAARIAVAKTRVPSHTMHPVKASAPADSDVQHAYDAAFELVQVQDRKAIPALQHFISQFPDSTQAASAQYWIGYLYYTRGFFKNAAAAQEQLLQRYPDSIKVPHAMYNLALCRLRLHDRAGAQHLLTALAEKYPTSNNAMLARKKLAEIEGSVVSSRD